MADAAGVPNEYSEGQRRQLHHTVFSQVLGENEEEDSLLEEIFGVQAKVKYEVFIEKCTKECKWIFSATQIRKRVKARLDAL